VASAALTMAVVPTTPAVAARSVREPGAVRHITLTVLRSYSSSETALYAKYSREFSAMHPGVVIKWVRPVTGTTLTKFETLDAAGDAPNVYMSEDANAAVLMARGALAPVDYKALGVPGFGALAKQYVSPQSLDAYVKNGVLYGIPQQLSNYGTFVNTKAFAAAHVPVPKTWAQVCADGPRLLVESGGTVQQEELALPINFPAAEVKIVDAVAAEYGKPIFNGTGTRSFLTSPQAIAALTMLQNLVYKCHAFVPALNGSTSAAERELFGEGRAAMVMDVGAWYGPVLKVSYPEVARVARVVAYPSGPGGVSVDPGYSYAYVVARSASNQGLSWDLVDYMKGTGLQELAMTGTFSGLKSVAGDKVAQKIPYWNTVWVPTLRKALFLPSLANASEIEQDVSNAYDSILLDHANVASALRSASANIAPLLNH
jgi:multiple sugar transport system substrate-binding protein